MLWNSRIPLAWKNLTYKPRRLAIRLIGIGFAVVLIFMEIGFLFGFLDSSTKLIHDLNADIILANKARVPLMTPHTFDRAHIARAAACEGVATSAPLYLAQSVIQHRKGKREYVRVVAFNPIDTLFFPVSTTCRNSISVPETALIDSRSTDRVFPDRSPGALGVQPTTEIGGRAIHLIGTFVMGRDFAFSGTIAMSDQNFARYFPNRAGRPTLSQVDVGVIRVTEGADAGEVAARLAAVLPAEIGVYTKPEFYRRERWFWLACTPAGFVFGLGCLLGLGVGVVICYHIIYTDISDHQPEYATLKAMGYRKSYFCRLVFQQAVYLSLLSFVPSMVVSWALYIELACTTRLVFELCVWRAVGVLMATVIMCSTSALIAMRKLLALDPAELF